jgi:hypothetical protein
MLIYNFYFHFFLIKSGAKIKASKNRSHFYSGFLNFKFCTVQSENATDWRELSEANFRSAGISPPG